MLSEVLVLLWSFLLTVMDGEVLGCECPQATVLTHFPPETPPEVCCLNYSGSSFGHVAWAVFSEVRSLEVLDLSDCNITEIHGATASPASLQELYLGHNELTGLPKHFLADASSLRVLDLRENFLERLPEDFLQASSCLRELRLDSNRLSALPPSVFRLSLEQVGLSDNPWDCGCLLVEELLGLRNHPHWGNDSNWQVAVGNLTCASPSGFAGRSVWSVQTSEVCQSPGLTALFIVLPLLLVFALLLCWCCGRKKKRKEGNFRPAKWAPEPVTAHHNGSKRDRRLNHAKPNLGMDSPSNGRRDVLLKNQLMLRPSSDLLSSSRDLYEEVEVKLGSADSLAPSASQELPEGTNLDLQDSLEAQEEDDRPDPETVSVTEVMKDSADREKAYLAQSTEYYSLVPGINLEDSDHGEYESVDLS